jgi:hypothetical protein
MSAVVITMSICLQRSAMMPAWRAIHSGGIGRA